MADPWNGKKGIDILAEIMQHMDPGPADALIRNLRKADPRIGGELARRIFTFDRLGECDERGIRLLLSKVAMRDLAIALKGVASSMLEYLARNMSQNTIETLREEIRLQGPTKVSDVEAARSRIVGQARDLMQQHQMFLRDPNERYIS
ncbi:MAG: hypothetical protein HQM09_11525 [Candidatus Riflebacteria bacterium]|nr:hypothetical protein [Candidatus Riflebacteria bacterium]